MSILLFGGTGLIGVHVARALRARGQNVAVASRSAPLASLGHTELTWIRCDIQDRRQVQQAYQVAKPEKVVHLAAALQFACESEPGLAVRVNIDGTTNILEAAHRAGIERVIFASSVAVYGETAAALHEDTPPAASCSLYGCAKWFEERLGIHYASRHRFKFVALRYCGVFGRGGSPSPGMARVRNRIEESRHGEPVAIAEASGEERIQLTYISDAVDATLLALDAPVPRYHVYNVAGPQSNYISLRQYGEVLRDLFPTAGEVRFSGRARSAGPLDTTRIRQDLGFEPRVSVREGLCQMFA